jgi:hypothetical protein
MKKGDKVIYDSRFGYDIALYQSEDDSNRGNVLVKMMSGDLLGRDLKGEVFSLPRSEIYPYDDKLQRELFAKHGYDKTFN